ncbi:tubulin epsilon and delta complex protein 1 isoform X2 [Nerophis ophidion]|uniref:tubulin epsilon and delta complex protein 1 isoform X2 n=1 Tax=Nerophis ophidion TaxID=159077 RepID=UPI002AE0A613|nr:tubulin epsilon and delta complex protein 1 isoform X2 [Nerophis ophidion]
MNEKGWLEMHGSSKKSVSSTTSTSSTSSERTGSVEVKQVIKLLCKLLAALGLQHVPAPETFRRAKFGQVHVEDQLWQLLADIQTKQTSSSSGSSTHLQNACECRAAVSAGLWQSGYYAGWMLREEEGVSTRELLLALGWQLASGTLEKLLTQRVQELDQTLITPTPVVKVEVSPQPEVQSSELRRLHWLLGSLRHQGQVLLSMREEQAVLLHAVFSSSPLPVFTSSSGEDCTVLSESCVGVQQLCDLLELYLRWREVETVFWMWMDSVVGCQVTEVVAERCTRTPSRGAGVCHTGHLCGQQLEDIQARLTTVQVLQTARVDAEDRGERLAGSSDTPSSLSLSQTYRGRLQAGRPRRQQQQGGQVWLCQVSQVLHERQRCLQERRKTLRKTNKLQLQDMMAMMEHLLLLAP